MLQSYWPDLVSGELPCGADVWEMTRVCVDKTVEPSVRRVIVPELLCAVSQHLEESHAKGVIGVTRAHLLGHFVRRGIRWLGEPALVEGEIERAFFVPWECLRPDHHCRKYGIGKVGLRIGEFVERAA